MFKLFAAAAVAVTMSAFAAEAATQQDCDEAIAAAQQAGEDNINIEEDEQKETEFSDMLADASQKGIEGDFDKCLQLVKDARGGFGLPK